jgi:hypothetical protein
VALVFRCNRTGLAAEGEAKVRPRTLLSQGRRAVEGEAKVRPRTLLSQGLAGRGVAEFGRGMTILPAFRASFQELWQGAHR